MFAAQDFANPLDGGLFALVKRPEIFHKRKIFFHLRKIAHTREHHTDLRKSCGKADGVAGLTAAVKRSQHICGFLGEMSQMTAPHRFHHNDRLTMPDADLIALGGLYTGVFHIYIVELELDNLNLWIGVRISSSTAAVS